MSLKDEVAMIVESKPCIRIALAEGLINYSALAKYIKEEVEAELGKKVSEGSVMLAIREIHLKQGKGSDVIKALKTSYYTIESNLIDYVVDWSLESVKKLFEKIAKEDVLLSIIVGKMYASIITHQNIDDYLDEIGIKPIKKIENLANFRVVIKKEYISSVGIIEEIIRKLVLHNISIVETASSFTEIGFIIREEDVIKAVNAYKSLV